MADTENEKNNNDKKKNKDFTKIPPGGLQTFGEKVYKLTIRIIVFVFLGGSLINHGGQNPLEPSKLGCKIIHGPYVDNFKEIYKKLNSMNISTKFKSYNHGTKIIEKKLNKKMLNFYDKKIITYGDKVLNLTYSEITRLI